MSKYFGYCPDAGFDTFDTEDEARTYAQASLGWFQDLSAHNGWDESVTQVCWGEIKQTAQMINEKTRVQCEEEGIYLSEDFDYYCEYELK